MHKIIVLITATFLLSGCFNTTQVQKQNSNKVQEIIPKWIDTPYKKNTIVSVASAPKQSSFKTTKKLAYANAKKQLQIVLQQKVSLSIQPLLPKENNLDLQKFTNTIVKDTIKKAKIIKLFETANGTIFVLNTVKISFIIESIQTNIQASHNTQLYQNFLMAKGDGSLELQLQNN